MYEEKESYYNVIKITEKAIDIICNGKSYRHLADFYFKKLKCEEILYNGTKQWKENKEKIFELCNDIFYMYIIEENQEKMRQIERFCEEKLKWQIIKPEIL